MNVFEIEKEFNDLIKQGQELIKKLKQEKENVKESDENDLGALCKFWSDDPRHYVVGILFEIFEYDDYYQYAMDCSCMCEYKHCRRLTPAEVAEITGYKVEE